MEQYKNSSTVTFDTVDFSQVMVDLHNAGFTVYRVSHTLSVAYCTADNWSKGGQPRYNLGVALLKLHASVCTTNTSVELKKNQA